MRRILALVWLSAFSSALVAQNEITLSLGRTLNNLSPGLTTTSGTALQANYARRFREIGRLALYGEIHLLANPQRQVAGPAALTRDFASLYLTPGIRIAANPHGRFRPFGVFGGGYALYEQSTTTVGGLANPAPRHIAHGAMALGAGVDLSVKPWLALRTEIRDFYTGVPGLNADNLRGGRHNTVASAGFVLRLGRQ